MQINYFGNCSKLYTKIRICKSFGNNTAKSKIASSNFTFFPVFATNVNVRMWQNLIIPNFYTQVVSFMLFQNS